MNPLPDAEKLCAQLAAELKPAVKPSTAMIGLYTGGVWLAQRLHAALAIADPLGTMDIAFYRDDYHQQGLARDPKRTQIPFAVEGRDLLLVDDVLYTGRTIRAAMNEIFDFGRPASICLVVLVERGGRELPIQAHVIGKSLELKSDEHVKLCGPEPLALEIKTTG